uniref:ZIP family metal transporter n=1 Tax=Ignisphaera aggregans TaxID=334771 RepID=A0A7C5XLX9_9CREN
MALNIEPGNVFYVMLYALIPAIATIMGSALIFLHTKVGEKMIDSGMGFAAGLMIYISFVDLLIPSFDFGSMALPFIGFIIGFAMIKLLDVLVPHIGIIHSKLHSSGKKLGKTILIALAIAIHNIPEGIAVGSSTIYNLDSGFRVALSIAIQDIPEGLAVAIPIYMTTNSYLKSFAIGVLSAVIEYISAFIALIGLIDTYLTLPLLLALSASAMIYVVVHEISPEIFGHEHDEYSTGGFFLGLLTGILFGVVYGG